jgi:MFS family permease
VSLIAAFFVDKLGRRFLFLFAGIGMLVTFPIWTACSATYAQNQSKAAGVTVVIMIFLLYGVAGAVWSGLIVSYTVEILPYNIRAKGLTLCYFWTSMAGIFNQWVNPLGMEALNWHFYFCLHCDVSRPSTSMSHHPILTFFDSLIIECLVIYFFSVETKGPTLEEIAILFDGKDSAAAQASANASAKVMVTEKETVP